jgi:hypothetical protein
MRRDGVLRRLAQAPGEREDDRALVRGGEVGAPLLELLRPQLAHGVEQRRLDPGEREVEARNAGDRKPERLGVAATGQCVDGGTARVAEPEQPRALVERLSGSVVERRAEPFGRAVPAHRQQEGVPPAREQADERRLDRLVTEVERRDVPLQVVDRNERDPPRPGDRLRRREPHEEGADQPGPARDADARDVAQPHSRLCQRLADHRGHELEMAAGGDLGDDAAVAGMELGLRGDDRREHGAVAGHDGGSRLVAGSLDAQDRRGCARAVRLGPRHCSLASVRSVTARP